MSAPHPRAVLATFLLGLAGTLLPSVWGQPEAQPPSPPQPDPIGRPKAFKPGKEAALALWFDKTDKNWHFELTTNKKSKDTFTGSVRADKGKLLGVFDKLDKGTKAVAGDLIIPHKDGGGFDFRFTNGGGVDRLQFVLAPEATKVTVHFLMNGLPAHGRVLIGQDGHRPEAAPISLPAHPVK